MSIGQRIREERARLGFSQAAFAALASATRGAQLKWEKDQASPNAVALVAFANAGVDLLYVLTGIRQEGRRQPAAAEIAKELRGIRDQIIFPTIPRHEDEGDEAYEARALKLAKNALRSIIRLDIDLPHETIKEIGQMFELTTDQKKLDYARRDFLEEQRSRRIKTRKKLETWLENQKPLSFEAMNILVRMSEEYGVPIPWLVDLVKEMSEGI